MFKKLLLVLPFLLVFPAYAGKITVSPVVVQDSSVDSLQYYSAASKAFAAATVGTGLSFTGGTLSATADLSGYVPYTGATNDVNLGSHTLTTTGDVTIGDDLNVASDFGLNMGGFEYARLRAFGGGQFITTRQLVQSSGTISVGSTVNIGGSSYNYVLASGTGTIDDFGSFVMEMGYSSIFFVEFDDVVTITDGDIENITGANITTDAGDVAVFVHEGTGGSSTSVKMIAYTRADGTALVGSGAGSTDFADLTTGTNTTATMTVGSGASIVLSGTGTVTASNVVAVDAAADTTTFPVLAGAATGSSQPLTDAGLAYNASTNALTITGALSASNVSGSNTGDQTTSGTTNRITVTNGTTNPTIDISSAYVGQNTITTLGTITTGVWTGTDIAYANLAQGSALSVLGVTGNATADVASIAAGTDGFVLRRSGTALAFGLVNLTATNPGVTGILPSANGGTSSAFFTVSGPATSAKTFTFPNANSTVLTSNAAVTVAQGGTGLTSGTQGGIPYYSTTGAMTSSGALTNNSPVLGGSTGSPKVVAGITSDGTSQLRLGVTASSVGSIQLFNATSGSITIQPVTGALGGVTLSVPAATTTIVGTDVSQVLTNKTLSSTTNTLPQEYCVALSDYTSDLTTGTAKGTLYLPEAATALRVRSFVNTAPTGSTIIVAVEENGTTILSTNITIDATEKTSGTAATPPVISDSSLAANSEITFDVNQVGSTIPGKGLVGCIEVAY